MVFGGIQNAEAKKDGHRDRHYDNRCDYNPRHHRDDRYRNRSSFSLFFNLSPQPVYRPTRTYVVERNNVVADVQYTLNRRGYNAGSVDGIMGRRTSDAIASYQADHGLYVTGDITPALLRHLGLA